MHHSVTVSRRHRDTRPQGHLWVPLLAHLLGGVQDYRRDEDVRCHTNVTVGNQPLNGVPAPQSLRVDVQVTGPNEVNVTLSGYRTNF